MRKLGWFHLFFAALGLGLASACGGVECAADDVACEAAVAEAAAGLADKPVVVVGKLVCEPDRVVVHADGTREEWGTCTNGSSSFTYWSKTSGALMLR